MSFYIPLNLYIKKYNPETELKVEDFLRPFSLHLHLKEQFYLPTKVLMKDLLKNFYRFECISPLDVLRSIQNVGSTEISLEDLQKCIIEKKFEEEGVE